MKIIKKEINIDEELRKKVEIICSFSNAEPVFKNGSVNRIEGTNLAYVEPHRAIINNYVFLFFNNRTDIFLGSLNNKYNLRDLEKLIKKPKYKKC